MKAIKIIRPESFKIMLPKRQTDAVKIIAGPLLIILTPTRVTADTASIRFMLDAENLDFTDFDKYNFMLNIDNI